MTNKEIKLELARVALNNTQSFEFDTLVRLYEWVIEETEDNNTEDNSTEYDDIDIRRLINAIERNRVCIGAGVRLANVFRTKNINTIGDLLRIDKQDFSRYEGVGRKTLWALEDALESFGINNWE